MPFTLKEDVITKYALLWEDWKCREIPDDTPEHVREYANMFTVDSGSNCLSSTLFAVTKQDWIIKEWVHPETFINTIERAGYSLTTERIRNGDLITWENDKNVVQHATYYIGNDLYFNKNGQTFFNPWKIVNSSELNEQWRHYKKKVYRKQ
ncbi:NlpC/P60 family protein [Alkalihalobacillus macyae]|uniref:NlpC/P60 family protein n=1 Tax=Guptibacillus hwajinpoensis TaxID=208199 RepID=UPI00273AF592|nr:NlpC/P60 family protein [Alkalihalobacillus macyae]MDP4553497.1 NlpC/P60 family protein [Alkalihalobacillus macyae]